MEKAAEKIEKVEEKKVEAAAPEEKKEDKKAASKLLKGKSWFTITAPPFFGEKQLGEALAADASTLPGRKVTASLMELNGDPSRYYMTMRFKITEISGTTAKTVFDGHECTRDFAARIVQRRTQRIDSNTVLTLKDGRIRVKTIAVCNRHVRESVAKVIQKMIIDMIVSSTEGKTMDEFITMFIDGGIQNFIRGEVNKVYPLRAFEFNKTEVL